MVILLLLGLFSAVSIDIPLKSFDYRTQFAGSCPNGIKELNLESIVDIKSINSKEIENGPIIGSYNPLLFKISSFYQIPYILVDYPIDVNYPTVFQFDLGFSSFKPFVQYIVTESKSTEIFMIDVETSGTF